MADNQQRVHSEGEKKGEGSAQELNSSLEDFVTDNYKKQKDAGKMDSTDELDDERTNQFFSRAIGESRRMNGEVNKSNKKLAALHTEFGMDMVNAWQDEHASEVLQPHEQKLVKQAQYQGDMLNS